MPETQETFELLKNYVNELPIGLLLFGKNLEILSWNNQAINMLEIHEENIKKNDFGTLKKQLMELIQDKTINERELIGLSKPYKASKKVASDNNVIVVLTESFQETIGEMSHELRRPLTNIKTLAESLHMGAKNDPDIAGKFIEQINNEADRLTKLVNALLNMSKIRSGKLAPAKQNINLKSKINDAIKLLQSHADKRKTKLINEVTDDYKIYADAEQIDHVIQNLIENAIKYSPDGSTVTISSGPASGGFQVSDTGIGIPLTEVSKIFERFYRVDRTKAKGSSGLGLSIVKNVIDLHGGKIEVNSEVGKGTTFIVSLPNEG